MAYNVGPLNELITQFERLPSIGRKTAQRLAFYILSQPKERAEKFSRKGRREDHRDALRGFTGVRPDKKTRSYSATYRQDRARRGRRDDLLELLREKRWQNKGIDFVF